VLEQVLREKNMLAEIDLMKEHIQKKRKPVEEFVRLLNEHGFKIEKIDNEQFDFRFVDATAMLNHFLMKLAFIGSWKEFVPRNFQEEIFKEIEIRLNRQVQNTGLLALTIPYVLIDSEKI